MLSGYLHKTRFSLVALIFILCIPRALSQVLVAPVNIVGFLGNRTTLDCEITQALQQWQEDYSENSIRTITSNNAVLDPYKERYGVEGDDGKYSLIVLTSQYEQSGTHTCLDVGDISQNRFKQAELIILDSNPVCTTNSTDVDNTLIESEYVRYMCQVQYMGLLEPKMAWSSNSGSSIIPDDESDNTQTPKLVRFTYSTVVLSDNNGQSVRVVTSFDRPPSVPENAAPDAPEYTYTWNSPSIIVHYPPRDIIFQYCTDSGCSPIGDSDEEISVNPGDRIHASAAANPNVDYYTWMNDTDIISEGIDKNELTFNYTGSSSIECIVRNTMRDREGTESRTILVMVVPTTTPPSTTTPIPTIPSSPETSTATGGPPATDEIIENDGLGAGAIAGIAIGVLAAIVICVIIIICVCRKSDKEKKANETMPPKKVHADQVRQPENNGPTTITNIDEKPPYDYNQYPENPYDNNVNPYAQDGRPNENLVYADLALDDTPRSRKPVQVFEPVQYAEIRRV